MTFSKYFLFIRQNAKFLFFSFSLSLFSAFLLCQFLPKRYEASAIVKIGISPSGKPISNFSVITERSRTDLFLIRAGVNNKESDLKRVKSGIQFKLLDESNFLISYRDVSPQGALELLRKYSTQIIDDDKIVALRDAEIRKKKIENLNSYLKSRLNSIDVECFSKNGDKCRKSPLILSVSSSEIDTVVSSFLSDAEMTRFDTDPHVTAYPVFPNKTVVYLLCFFLGGAGALAYILGVKKNDK